MGLICYYDPRMKGYPMKQNLFALASCVVVWASLMAMGADESPKLSNAGATSATTRSAAVKTTTAAELADTLKKMQDEQKQLAKIALFDLKEPVTEKPAQFVLFGEQDRVTHLSLLRRLREAAADKELAGVLITVIGGELKLAQAQELRDTLDVVKAAGKKVFIYADTYSTATYILATGATEICLMPGGEIELPGVAVETMFAKGLLDKVGLHADMIQIGEYKGANESLTRTTASDELKGELNRLVDSLYWQIVRDVAARRNISQKSVQALVDQAMIPAASAKEAKLVDTLVDIDGLRDLMASRVGKKVDLIADYAHDKRDDVDFSNPFAILQILGKKQKVSSEPAIAVVYVDGMIVSGDGTDSLFGDSVAADGAIRKAMRIAQRDPSVKAVVLRIDSPGGSALASEAAWQAVRRVAAMKPVVVSVGGMAASGGYYIAAAGERIFADPAAIVGSIGVVGGKIAMEGLYEKIGVKAEVFSRGANAGMFSSAQPFTESQRVMVRGLMTQTYDQFVERVMTTRSKKIKDIDKVARGRIFTAESAVELGLVDELGGMQKAIEYAAIKAGLEPAGYDLRVLPAPKTLGDLIQGNTDAKSGFNPRTQAIPMELLALPAGTRRMLLGQMAMAIEMQKRPVMVVMPVMMGIR